MLVITVVVNTMEVGFNFGRICIHWASEKLVFEYSVAGVDLKRCSMNQTSTTAMHTKCLLVDCLKVGTRELGKLDFEQGERTKRSRAR